MNKQDILGTLGKEGLILPEKMKKASNGGFELGFKGGKDNRKENKRQERSWSFHPSFNFHQGQVPNLPLQKVKIVEFHFIPIFTSILSQC